MEIAKHFPFQWHILSRRAEIPFLMSIVPDHLLCLCFSEARHHHLSTLALTLMYPLVYYSSRRNYVNNMNTTKFTVKLTAADSQMANLSALESKMKLNIKLYSMKTIAQILVENVHREKLINWSMI